MRASYPPLIGEAFAKVILPDAVDVADATRIVCATFGWGAPMKIVLYSVRSDARALRVQDDPSSAAEIFAGASLLANEPVERGAWLLARVAPRPAAVGAFSSTAGRRGPRARAALTLAAFTLAVPRPPQMKWRISSRPC